VTKLQRGIESSNILKGASVVSDKGQVLVELGKTEPIFFRGDLTKDQLNLVGKGLFESTFGIRSEGITVFIFTGEPSFVYVCVLIISYLFVVGALFWFPTNKLLGHQEDLRTQLKLKSIQEKLAFSEAMNLISKQVSHDIRSPLSALSVVADTLPEVSEAKRVLIQQAIQRINGIANDLLKKGRQDSFPKAESAPVSDWDVGESHDILPLPSLVDQILAEKKIQYVGLPDVQIGSDFRNGENAFIKANSKEVQRLLSNLINNAVEALIDRKGKISVAIRTYKESVSLSVKDNGKGIPPEVLDKLGMAGFSYGKEGAEGGNGLGIFHAKKTIEALGGRFNISSQVGAGTIVEIGFPRETCLDQST
jgi:signal transduction histidine kinase